MQTVSMLAGLHASRNMARAVLSVSQTICGSSKYFARYFTHLTVFPSNNLTGGATVALVGMCYLQFASLFGGSMSSFHTRLTVCTCTV